MSVIKRRMRNVGLPNVQWSAWLGTKPLPEDAKTFSNDPHERSAFVTAGDGVGRHLGGRRCLAAACTSSVLAGRPRETTFHSRAPPPFIEPLALSKPPSLGSDPPFETVLCRPGSTVSSGRVGVHLCPGVSTTGGGGRPWARGEGRGAVRGRDVRPGGAVLHRVLLPGRLVLARAPWEAEGCLAAPTVKRGHRNHWQCFGRKTVGV